MGGTFLGSWVKVFSVARDRFWVTFLGQTIVALSQVYAFSIATPLAATWFGPSQVSTACAIGVFGLMVLLHAPVHQVAHFIIHNILAAGKCAGHVAADSFSADRFRPAKSGGRTIQHVLH